MAPITFDKTMETQLDQVAAFFGITIEELVEQAVQARLRDLQGQKLETETAAFERMHETLIQQYLGQFVALHDGQVVDHDAAFEPLFLRIQERFGSLAVLIREVTPNKEQRFHFRSPRMERSA